MGCSGSTAGNASQSKKKAGGKAPEAAPQMDPAFLADLHAFIDEGFENWKANATEEQKACGAREIERFSTDPEFAAQLDKEVKDLYAACNESKSGILNEAEFIQFYKGICDSGAKRGNYEDEREDTPAKTFALYNRLNDADGVSMKDFEACTGVVVMRNIENKTKAGL